MKSLRRFGFLNLEPARGCRSAMSQVSPIVHHVNLTYLTSQGDPAPTAISRTSTPLLKETFPLQGFTSPTTRIRRKIGRRCRESLDGGLANGGLRYFSNKKSRRLPTTVVILRRKFPQVLFAPPSVRNLQGHFQKLVSVYRFSLPLDNLVIFCQILV